MLSVLTAFTGENGSSGTPRVILIRIQRVESLAFNGRAYNDANRRDLPKAARGLIRPDWAVTTTVALTHHQPPASRTMTLRPWRGDMRKNISKCDALHTLPFR